MAQDSRFEYVRFDYHSDVVGDLERTSKEMQSSVSQTFEASELQMQKHEKIVEAKEKISDILEALEKLNKLLMQDEYKASIRPRYAPKSVVYSEMKRAAEGRRAPREDKDVLVRSERALQNLQKNLEILKRQLK
ncbi:MAG: hypothetical protein V1839_02525 [archaeon]